jgi:RNA polymerase sigma-70 factor, ECF subfamily
MTAAERFTQARPRLLRLAYSELGDVGEAEDVVQEAWLRLERADAEAIENLDGWLTTVVARLALDRLRSARARRETYVGPWLPEPLVSDDPADRVTLDESVSYALLTVLEQLSPAERTAFVLHDVFDVPFGEVAEVVGRTPEAVRQLASRARRHVERERPRFAASRDEHDRAVRAFAQAVAEGNLEGLVAVLDPDVVWTSDGGGRANAARKPLRGGARVARAWAALSRKAVHEPIEIKLNGRLGLVLPSDDGHRAALSFVVSDGRIARIDAVRNPEKLRRLGTKCRSIRAPRGGELSQRQDDNADEDGG